MNRLVPSGVPNHNHVVDRGTHNSTTSDSIFLEKLEKKLGLQIFDLHFWSEIKSKNLRKNHPVNNIWNFSEMIKYWKASLKLGSINFRLLNFSNVPHWPLLENHRFVVTCNSVTFVTILMRHKIVLFWHVLNPKLGVKRNLFSKTFVFDAKIKPKFECRSLPKWNRQWPNVIRRVLFFGPEKCLKEFKSRVGVAPKKRFWSTVFSLRKWTKINF